MDIMNSIVKDKNWNIFYASHYCRLSQLDTSDRLKRYLIEAEKGIKNSNDKDVILSCCNVALYVGYLDDCRPSYIYHAIKNTLDFYNKSSIVNIDDLLLLDFESAEEPVLSVNNTGATNISIPVNTRSLNAAVPIATKKDFNSEKISPSAIINNIVSDSASRQQEINSVTQQPMEPNVMQFQNALQNIMRHINFVKTHNNIDANDLNAFAWLINHPMLNALLQENYVNNSVPYINECSDYVPKDRYDYKFFVELPRSNMKLYIKFSTKMQNNSYPLEYTIK